MCFHRCNVKIWYCNAISLLTLSRLDCLTSDMIDYSMHCSAPHNHPVDITNVLSYMMTFKGIKSMTFTRFRSVNLARFIVEMTEKLNSVHMFDL